MIESHVVARLAAVSKRFGAVQALQDVDLDVRRGEVHALLGPNGAGKTTAVSLLLGLLHADAGEVALFDQAPQALAARRRCGAMLQTAGVPETLAVGELIALFRSYYPQPRTVTDIVDLAGVGALLRRRYGTLSGGQQRQVQFALALAGDAELLFLDEPTTGLDITARATMWKTVRRLVADGCAIVLTTHYLEEAEALADRVSVLARGRVVAHGSVQQIQARVAQRQIRCVSAVAAEAVSAWPGVRSVARDGARLDIVADGAEAVVRRLLAADDALSDLEVRRAGLADAFVEITKEAA